MLLNKEDVAENKLQHQQLSPTRFVALMYWDLRSMSLRISWKFQVRSPGLRITQIVIHTKPQKMRRRCSTGINGGIKEPVGFDLTITKCNKPVVVWVPVLPFCGCSRCSKYFTGKRFSNEDLVRFI
jgi:hypothetical protein